MTRFRIELTSDIYNSGYEGLAIAIIKQAVDDYKQINLGRGEMRTIPANIRTCGSILDFLRSPTGDLYSFGHGDRIADALERGEI